MVSKKIRIEFADTSYRAVDYLQDIREATENAGLNLFSRHNVRLQYPMPHDGIVMVEIQIPDDIAESFPIGHHLRGITLYMMKKWNEKYKNMFVGNRLLVFTVIPQPNVMTEMSDCEKMEILIKFARLLQRTDDEAACEIRAIKDILEDKE